MNDKIYIQKKKLDDNKLHLKYKSGNVVGFGNVPITDTLKKFLKNYIKNDKVSITIYNKLDDNDKKLLHKMFERLKLQEKLPELDEDDEVDIDDLIEKFQMNRGAIQAGLDNTEIRKEFKEQILKLLDLGIITDIPKAMEIIDNLNV